MDDTISRAAAIDALNLADDRGQIHTLLDVITVIKALPPTCHLLEDGTLIVKVPNLSAVHRVIVDAEDSQYCKTFYQDGDEDDEPVHDCLNCRHGDESPTAEPCGKCRYKFNNTPTKWEPEEG